MKKIFTLFAALAMVISMSAATWTVAGEPAAVFHNHNWSNNAAANDMVQQADGTFKWERTDLTLAENTKIQFKVCKDHGWTTAYPSSNYELPIQKSGVYTITITFNPSGNKVEATATLQEEQEVIATVAVKGAWDNWANTTALTLAEDKKTAATTIAVAKAGDFKFGLEVNGGFVANGGTVSRTTNSVANLSGNTGDMTLKADMAGDYTFTWEYATKTLTVTYPTLPVKYNVTVTAENGTVTGAGEYEEGKEATLTADPAEGYEFVKWTKGEEVVSAENPYKFTVTADVALVANFAKKVYTVTVTAENGTIEGLAADGKYEHGEQATLTATAAEGYEFVNWTVGETFVTENPYKFTVTADVALVANFAKKVYTVTVTAENGTVAGLAVDGKYEHGAEVTLTATANDGYEFVNWTVGGKEVSAKNPYTFTVTADVALVANFIKKTISYELNGGAFPEVKVPTNAELWGTDTADVNGFMHYYNHYYNLKRATQTIENVASFANAKMQQIMTDEASEYKWLGDYIQTVATAAGKPLSTDMAAPNESGWRWSVWAFFNAAAGQHGSAGIDFTEAGKPEVWGAAYLAEYGVVLPTEPVDAPYTLPTPVKEGYNFVGWYDNAEGTGEPMTVIPAGWDGTLYAIWVEIYTITVEAENGTVEGAGNYEHGAEATLTAAPAEGYEFVSWTKGEEVVSTENPYTFTVAANVDLVANFEVALPGTVALSCTGMNKMYMAMRDMLQLKGTSANDEYVTVAIPNYKATVGDYQAFITFGDLELETESLKITRGSDEWTLAATIDADTAIYEFTATTAAPKTETIAPREAIWGGDAMNGYIIDCTTTSGTVQIGLMDGTAYGMGWMLSLSINDELLVEGATIDAPTWEEDNLVLDVTVVSGTLDEYTIQLTATPKPAIEVIANATMALSEDEYEVGTMIVSATWNEHPLTVKLNGWPYYGYGEYAEANLVIEIDPENYDVVDAYSTAKLEKKEDVAVLTGTFSHWDGNKYALTLTIAEPAAAPVVETVNVVCTDMVQGEEWGTPVLTGTCDLGDINISLNLEDTDHPESVYGEYGFAEYPMGLFPAVEVTIEGEDSFIMLELMENTVAVYTDGETQDSFVGTFLGSDWKVYVLDMKTPAPENPSALDNVTTTVAPIKMIENGQLMIIKNGVQYNAQGAVVK